MSDILFKCAGCSMTLAVSDKLAGQSFACPSCQAAIQAPAPVIRFLCPSCSSELSTPYALRNEVVSCPGCETAMRVPGKLVVQCSSCSASLEVEDQYYQQLAGTQIECPECWAPVLVPSGVVLSKAETKPEPPLVDLEPVESLPEQEVVEQEIVPEKKEVKKPMAQYESGFAQKTMRLDDFLEDISQANALKGGKCPYCNSDLKRLHNKAFVCQRCNRVLRTVKRTIR